MRKFGCNIVVFIFVLFSSFYFLSSVVFASTQAEIFISPSGDDANPGTIQAPYKTLQKARDTVRTINQNMTGDIVVNLRGGTYELSSTLTLDPSDSGTNGFNIVWQSYPEENAVISGGRKITGWVKEGNLWKAGIGTGINSRQLYVNGVRAVRARSIEGLSGAIKTLNGYTTTDLNMQNWGDKKDIELVANLAWKQFRCPIDLITNGEITMQQPCWTNANLHKDTSVGWDLTMPVPTWIENAFELLDSPGEWYLNRQTGFIYYYPKSNEDPNNEEIVLPILENLIVGSELTNVTFKNLVFSYATWLRPGSSEGFAEMQGNLTVTGTNFLSNADLYKLPLGVWTKPMANISFSHAKAIVFDNDKFSHLGGAGLNFDNGTKDSSVFGSEFTDISSSGIIIGDVNLPNTTDAREITSDVKINNSSIHNTASEYQGGLGIWVGYTQNTNIQNNIIFDLPYSAVSIGWGWGYNDPTIAKNNVVKNNLIYDFVKTMYDGGGIYSLSDQPGNIYSDNVIISTKTRVSWDYNIYLDERSRHIEVANNISLLNDSSYSSLIKGGDHNIHDNWWQKNDDNHDGTITGDAANCIPTKCGLSMVNNNHIITNLSQAPPSILTSVGPMPQKLFPSGTISSGSQNVSWELVPGTSGYLLRIDDLTDAWTCSNQQQYDVCSGTITNTYFPYNFQQNHSYRIWVHPIFSITNTYGIPAISLVSVRSPTPTTIPPTSTPIPPTSTPTSPAIASATPTPTPLPGDITGPFGFRDGKVNIYDYNLLITDFGKSGSPADIDGNGMIDIYDYNTLIGNFGR